MALIKFQLHNQYADGSYPIRLSYLCQDKRYFKEPMKDDCRARIGKAGTWKKTTGRFIPSAKNSGLLNHYLDEWEKRVYAIIKEIRLTTQQVTPEAIRAKLKGETKSFWEFFEWLILNPPADWGQSTLQSYEKQRNLFRRFEKKHYGISFAGINQQFADDLTNFMRTESYKTEKKSGEKLYYNDTTIKNTFRRISGITTYAIKYGVLSSKVKITTPAKGIDAGAIYLTIEEIKLAYEKGNNLPKDLPSRSEVNRYTDFFTLGTQLGSRIGYLNIGPENKVEKNGKLYLNLSTNKLPVQVIIPLSPLAIEILEKYNWSIKNVIEQKMNDHIKTAYKLAGFTETVIHRAIEQGKLIERKYQKWEMVSSHSMRRSFCTNMMKAGAPVLMIMKISGHKSINSFMRYIRIENQEAAEMLEKYF